jgi:hypothetical protein
MRCRYCFYADVAENREVANMGLMSHETAEKLIRASFADVDKNGQVNFSFQGGEPTMAGLDFYRDFVSMVEAYKPEKVSVNYALQTNGRGHACCMIIIFLWVCLWMVIKNFMICIGLMLSRRVLIIALRKLCVFWRNTK